MGWKWENSVDDHRPTYACWSDMRRRCYNPDNTSFEDYGGRGIAVCERWRNDYDAFVDDMGFRPEGTTIDRIDNDGDYAPGNCRWATVSTQARNKRSNIYHRQDIIETDLAAAANINLRTLRSRIAAWGDVDEALTRPVAIKALQSPHGSRKRYERYGCRCDLCRQATAEHGRQQRLKRKARSNGWA